MKNEVPFAPLDKLVALRSEKVTPADKDPALPYIGLEHLAQGSPRLIGTAASGSSVSTNTIFSKNDILFGKLRPNLRKSLLASFDGYCSTDILVLRCLDGIIPSFAGYVFQWDRVFAAATASAVGTKMPRTSWRELRNVQVFKPTSPSEQSSIATVLDALENVLVNSEAVLAKLRQLRSGLIDDLLIYGFNENGEIRNPLMEPGDFTISSQGVLPHDWVFETLGKRLEQNLGTIQTGPFGSQLHAHEYTPEGVPVIMPQDIHDGQFDDTSIARIPKSR